MHVTMFKYLVCFPNSCFIKDWNKQQIKVHNFGQGRLVVEMMHRLCHRAGSERRDDEEGKKGQRIGNFRPGGRAEWEWGSGSEGCKRERK